MEALFNIPININNDFAFYTLAAALSLVIFIVICILFSKNLIKTIMLMSAFSIISSLCYLLLDAPDVAMTEMALGTALSTCVLLNVANIIAKEDIQANIAYIRLAIAICIIITFLVLMLPILLELPQFGNPDNQIHHAASKYYIQNTMNDTGIASAVAAILASYRGYDTLGETTVILIAALGVLLITNRNTKNV
jgi:multicomponent Na+:H+ antiporter subunit B